MYCNAECCYVVFRYAVCRYAEYQYAEYRYAEFCNALKLLFFNHSLPFNTLTKCGTNSGHRA
jgi:hypothetical protein